MSKLQDEVLKLKMELATVIMGYERELAQQKREDISDFSKGCMERYFQLTKELQETQENSSAN